MQIWKTIAVVILLATVGVYALYIAHQPALEATPKLFTVASTDIRKIELRAPGRDIVIERAKEGGWRIVQPIQAKADRVAADGMADAIANVQITGKVDEKPSDLAPFGLAQPAVVVTAITKDNKALPEISVGKDTPVGNSAYIMAADKPGILLVANSFPAEVNKNIDDLRSRILIGFKPEDVRKIVLEGSGKTLELDRQGAQWTIVKPQHYPADNAAVRQMLDSLTNAHVDEFADDSPSDLSKYGLANPSFKAELYGKDNAKESILFGFKQPEADKSAIYVRRGEGADQPVATVGEYVLNAADKNFDDLRDKTVLVFDQADVGKVTLAGGPISEALERASGGKWNIAANGKSAAAETPVAESLLDQIHDLKATKISEDPMTNPKRYGMVTPTLTLTLYARDGKEIGAVRMSTIQETTTAPETAEGQPPKPKTQFIGYATISTNPAVYQIPAQAVTDLENTTSRLHADVAATPSPSAAAHATPGGSASASPSAPPPPSPPAP